MTDKEIAQLRACLDASDIKSYLAWKKVQEVMKCTVRISRETLDEAFYLLSEKWADVMVKADYARNPELANIYKAKAQKIGALLDEIAAALDPKE